MTKQTIQDLLAKDYSSTSALDLLRWALETFHPKIAVASSFGAQDVALIHMAYQINPRVRVFTLDTGRLPHETYEVMEASRQRFPGLVLEILFPEREAVEKMVRAKGPNLFYESVENRLACCGVRKVEPLNRMLATLDAWISGVRSRQSVTRTDFKKVEWDAERKIVKINPLLDWSRDQVWEYVRRHHVPYNKLHDQGYPSIGCAPCTRAVKPGEDERAGRWWWEQTAQKECGLHVKKSREKKPD